MTADGLQPRLAMFCKRMFWAFLALRVAELALYTTWPDIEPAHYAAIFAIGACSVGVLGVAWGVLARVSLARAALGAIDLGVTVMCGGVFGAIAMLAWNRPASAYTCLVYACFVVFTRTIVVPSSGRRSALVVGLALAPLGAAAIYLACTTKEAVPPVAFSLGGVLYAALAVAIAATGSRVIYGLRRRVSSYEELELGQYRLVRTVGAGPSGEVFVARHALLRRPTAVKLLHAERLGEGVLARRERAVQEMSRLRHHNTAAVYDYGRSPDGVFYIAMEYLEGISLEALLERYGAQPPARAIAIVVQLCGALHEAHARDFAHGNLTLPNVIICERGGLADVAKLTDFGFGRDAATHADDLRALGAIAARLIGEHADAARIAACFAEVASAKQLASRLRALGYDWSAASARAWWADFHRTSAPFLQVPQRISVALGRR